MEESLNWRGNWRSHSLVVLVRLLSIGAGLGYVKVYTGALSPDEVGAFFYLATLSYVLNALIFVPVDFYVQARVATLDELPRIGIQTLASRVLLVGLVACGLLSAPLIYLGKLHPGDLPALYAVAALLYLCTSLRGVLNNRGHTVFVSGMLLLESTGRLVAFVGAVAIFGASARTLLVSSALALGVEFAFILVHARRQLAFSNVAGTLDDAATIFRSAAPIGGAAVCNALQLQTYRIAYSLAGLGVTSGIYGVVSNIGAAAMSACGSIFSQIQTPRLYQSGGATIGRFVGLATVLSTGVLLMTMACAPFLVRLLTKEEYVPFALAIGFGVITEACNLIIGGYAVLLTLEQRQGMLFRFNLAAATLSVFGCLCTLHLWPQDPLLIGFSIVGSQLLMTFSIVTFASRRMFRNR